MSKKISDDKLKEYISRLDSEALTQWLIEQCQDDDKLRTSLLDLAAPKDAVKSLISEIRSRISGAWAKAKGRNGFRQAANIRKELDLVLQSINGIIEKSCYLEAEKILVRYIQAAEKYGVYVDDSYGYLWPICQDGVTLWGKVWAKIEPRDKIALAELIYSNMHNNVNGLKDNIITDFKEALGDEGLQYLKEKLMREFMALADNNKYTLSGHLENIADALGDVDLYIEINRLTDSLNRNSAQIARRLYEAGRYQEALSYIDGANNSQLAAMQGNCGKLRCEILIALGRDDEALETLWNEFRLRLSSYTLDEILELVGSDQAEQINQKAYAIALEHKNIYDAMTFFCEYGHLSAAADLIEQRQDKISGSNYDTILPITKKLKNEFPVQSWILLKALAVDILESSRYEAYGHAVKYVNRMKELAQQARIDDRQTEFIEYLNRKHARKSSFWAKLNGSR